MEKDPAEHEVRIRVRYQETDRMGVVYHSNHFHYFEVGRTEAMRARGIVYTGVEARGFALAVLESHAVHTGPATYDDELAVFTKVSAEGKTKMRFEYRVENLTTGKQACSGYTLHVLLGPDRRPARLPDDILAACQ